MGNDDFDQQPLSHVRLEAAKACARAAKAAADAVALQDPNRLTLEFVRTASEAALVFARASTELAQP